MSRDSVGECSDSSLIFRHVGTNSVQQQLLSKGPLYMEPPADAKLRMSGIWKGEVGKLEREASFL